MRLNETGRLLLSLYLPAQALSFGQRMLIPGIPIRRGQRDEA